MILRSKLSKILTIISIILLLASLGYLSYTLYLYKGIETFYRIILIIIGLYISLAIISSIYFTNKKDKKVRYIITVIFQVIFTIIFIAASIFIKSVYNKLSDISEEKTNTYTTKLISFEDYKINNVKDKKIGIVENEEDIEYYILPSEVIKEYELDKNNEIITYSTSLELIHALYENEVDLIFVSKSYIDIFSTFEEYADIEEKAKEIYSYEKEYEAPKEEDTASVKKLTEPFTVLILGIDSKNEVLAKNASFNGDTMMLVTFNPKTFSATMTSFPRDTFVPVACVGGKLQRINTSTWCGTNGAVRTVENLTGIDINYYVKINFKGLVKLVDALGGIDVDVPYSFCEQNSSRKWGSNTVYVEKGQQHLNGEQALALTRNRHKPNDGSNVGKTMAKYCPDYTGGSRSDFQRNTNQQLVIKGIIKAAKNIDSITKINEILDTISTSIDTNMKVDQMLSGYDLIKSVALNKNADVLNIQRTKLKTYSIGKSGHMIYEPSTKRYTSVLFYYNQSLKDIVNALKINLGLKKGTMIKTFEFDLANLYKEKVIGDGSYSQTRYTLIPNFSKYSVSQIKSFADKNSLKLNFINLETNETVEIDSYADYSFSHQNEKEYTPVFRINSITIYVKSKLPTQTIPLPDDTTNTTPPEEESSPEEETNNSQNNEVDKEETDSEESTQTSTPSNTE